jgi:hypothetical protein
MKLSTTTPAPMTPAAEPSESMKPLKSVTYATIICHRPVTTPGQPSGLSVRVIVYVTVKLLHHRPQDDMEAVVPPYEGSAARDPPTCLASSLILTVYRTSHCWRENQSSSVRDTLVVSMRKFQLQMAGDVNSEPHMSCMYTGSNVTSATRK